MDPRELQALSAIESAIFIDPGGRGLSNLWTPGCLAAVVGRLPCCDRFRPGYVLTGFCCNGTASETDGPLGSSVLCAALRSLGYNAHLLCDPPSAAVVRAAALESPVCVAEAPSAVPAPAFVIAVERPGISRSGAYRTMRAVALSGVAPLDRLLPSPAGTPAYLTIAVGDGGNEAGTGNIADRVAQCVPLGEQICTDVCCDVLVMAGVSNWGAIAIAAAMIVHHRKSEAAREFLKNCAEQRNILRAMIGAGAYDGVTGIGEESVDGMRMEKEHQAVTDEICNVVKKHFSDM